MLGLLSAALPALIAPLAPVSSGGRFEGGGWAVVVVPVVLMVGLVVGAVLLLIGLSWLVLALSCAVLTALAVVGYVSGGWGGGGFLEPALVLPLLTLVLAVLPGVRRWVAARRAVRVGR